MALGPASVRIFFACWEERPFNATSLQYKRHAALPHPSQRQKSIDPRRWHHRLPFWLRSGQQARSCRTGKETGLAIAMWNVWSLSLHSFGRRHETTQLTENDPHSRRPHESGFSRGVFALKWSETTGSLGNGCLQLTGSRQEHLSSHRSTQLDIVGNKVGPQ